MGATEFFISKNVIAKIVSLVCFVCVTEAMKKLSA